MFRFAAEMRLLDDELSRHRGRVDVAVEVVCARLINGR